MKVEINVRKTKVTATKRQKLSKEKKNANTFLKKLMR